MLVSLSSQRACWQLALRRRLRPLKDRVHRLTRFRGKRRISEKRRCAAENRLPAVLLGAEFAAQQLSGLQSTPPMPEAWNNIVTKIRVQPLQVVDREVDRSSWRQ